MIIRIYRGMLRLFSIVIVLTVFLPSFHKSPGNGKWSCDRDIINIINIINIQSWLDIKKIYGEN